MDASPILRDLLTVLGAGFIAGLICRRLGVSMLLGYLLAGVVLSRGVLNLVGDEDHGIEQLAHIGVLLLLFSIGLEFSLEELTRLARDLVLGGGVQMTVCIVAVTLFSMALGMPWRPAVLIASAVALSSTVLVFKALAENGETASPYGRRAIAVLLFQDIALVPLMLVIPLLTGTETSADPFDFVVLVATTAFVVVGVLALRAALRHWLTDLLARLRSPELVVLFTLLVLGGMCLVTESAGLPSSMGAFAAGLVFSGNRLTAQVDALILPFRESFAAIFFVSLGLLLDPSIIRSEGLLLLAGLVAVVALKTIAGALALAITGLNWRAALGMGMGMAQMGEFSFVLVLEGRQAGLLTDADYQRMLCFAIGTLILTPQLIRVGLRWTEGGDWSDTESSHAGSFLIGAQESIVVGLGPVGRQVASRLEIAGLVVHLVDLSPVNLHPFAQQGFHTVPGDASDPNVLSRASAVSARLIVICIPDDLAAVRAVRTARQLNREGYILVRCRYAGNVSLLSKAGANAIVSEEEQASDALLRALEKLERTVDF